MKKNTLKPKSNFRYKLASILVLFISIQFCAFSQNVVTWNELASLNGGIDSNNILVVGSNDRLVLTHSCNTDLNHVVRGIIVYGEFIIEDADANDCGTLSITTDFILVAQNGLFQVGSETDPYDNDILITLTGNEGEDIDLNAVINETEEYIPSSVDMGSNTPSARMLENMVGVDNISFIMAMGNNAIIQMHSTDALNKKTWVQLNATANAGDTVLNFDQETGWEIGDRIAIASTDFDWNQAEDFTIIAVANNGRTVTIDRGLEYMHYGEIETYSNGTRNWDLDMRAEVGLLSRKIKVRGDVNYDNSRPLNNQPDEYGGHIMAMEHGELYLSGVEFEHMGQASILGRYPTHWHMLADASGQYIKNCSYHHTFNKGMTIHGTQNTLIQENVIYENIGHSFFFEDGSEFGNQVIDNLAINARRPRTSSEATSGSSDFSNTSNFWIERSDNTFRGNHAAGSEKRGFHFQLKGVSGLSRGLYESNREGPRDFVGNVAHSTGRALFVDHGTYVNGGYRGTDEAPQAVDESWSINDFTAYKAERGTYIRGIGGDLYEVKIAEMADGTAYRFNQSLNNSLIVGRTSNIGTPVTSEEIAAGRSLPKGGYYLGHQLYDGPGGLNNVHFSGFGSSDYAIKESNSVHKSTLHYVNKVTFDPSIAHRNKFKVSRAILESKGVVDIDGSLTGVPGAQMIGRLNNQGDDLLYAAPGYRIDTDWGVVINPPGYDAGSFKFQGDFYGGDTRTNDTPVNGTVVENNGEISTRVVISRDDGEFTYDFGPGSTVRDQSLFVTNSHNYKISIVNAPPTFRLYMNDLPMGKGIIYEIEGLNMDYTDLTLDDESQTRLPAVSSMEDLESATTTSVYRNHTEDRLFVKFVAQMRHGFSYPQPRMTFENKLYGGVKIDLTLLDFPLSTNENELNSEAISIYPNPTSGLFSLNLKDHQIQPNDKIQIVSLLGQIISEYDAKLNDESYDISELKNGMYFVVLKTMGKTVYSNKIIKRD